ncbi:MAG TPA: hypothetical protein VGM81_14680 [Burkholderiaceae bacterium]
MKRALVWLRRCFSLWIALVSVLGTAVFWRAGVSYGMPHWLLALIGAVEAVAALAFFWRPGGSALAGLMAAYAAGAVVHIGVGQPPWLLLGYAVLSASFYLLDNAILKPRIPASPP